ncbi:hypothetical protein SUGI_0971080 [Cryptomeria japonica]|nr:hypothetical protein SUGI_0971080 [Cryptomeria japonica]
MDQKKKVRCSMALMMLLLLISAGLANGDGSESERRYVRFSSDHGRQARRERYIPPAPRGNIGKSSHVPPGAPGPSIA